MADDHQSKFRRGNRGSSPAFGTLDLPNGAAASAERDFGLSPNIRWVILSLSCWIMFGNYYAFDNPSALNQQLQHWFLPPAQFPPSHPGHADFQYNLNLMYSVYSVPNIFLPFFAGAALDRFGSHKILMILSFLVCLGQAIVAIGVGHKSWPVMLFGRVIFGMGGESLAVAQARLVTDWFAGKELALAVGLTLSVARLGTVFNNILSPFVANHSTISTAMWVGFISCMISWICTAATVAIDNVYRQDAHETDGGIFKQKHSREASVSIVESIHPAFWLVVLICFLYSSDMVPYNNVASAYLMRRYYPGDQYRANFAMSIPDLLSIFLVPLLGIFVDRSGRRLAVIFVGGLAFATGHAFLSTAVLGAIAPLFFIGLGYSTLLALWACVPCLVTRFHHATAYGTLTAACNLAITVCPVVVAALINADETYTACGMFFAIMGGVGVLVSLVLMVINEVHSLHLNHADHVVGRAFGGFKPGRPSLHNISRTNARRVSVPVSSVVLTIAGPVVTTSPTLPSMSVVSLPVPSDLHVQVDDTTPLSQNNFELYDEDTDEDLNGAIQLDSVSIH